MEGNVRSSFETVSLRARRKDLPLPTFEDLDGAHGVTRPTFHPFDRMGNLP